MTELRRLLAQAGLRPGELKGQTAVVTGAGRGIGRGAAIALGLLGARVVLAERDEPAGRETEWLIRNAGGEALFVPTDVSVAADVARLAEAAGQAWPGAVGTGPAGTGAPWPVTILINNAMLCPVVPVSEMSLDEWDRVMAVNLRGAFLTVKAFLPGMRVERRGTIVNMVSTDAMPGLSAYIASKQGLAGFTQSLAAEVSGEGIRVVAFGPGMVDTPGIRAAGHELAPLLGMKREEFFALSLHPAYQGLMPTDHAALATAYLVARLAGEYNGEAVTGYAVLERAGVIGAGAGGTAAGRDGSDRGGGADEARAEGAQAGGAGEGELVRLAGRLEVILAETAQDFEKLPLFVRPLARAGFKGKTGLPIQEWQRTAADLRSRAEQGRPLDGARLAPLLAKLIAYVEGVPAETARFTRDQALLGQVAKRMTEYARDLRALAQSLEEAKKP